MSPVHLFKIDLDSKKSSRSVRLPHQQQGPSPSYCLQPRGFCLLTGHVQSQQGTAKLLSRLGSTTAVGLRRVCATNEVFHAPTRRGSARIAKSPGWRPASAEGSCVTNDPIKSVLTGIRKFPRACTRRSSARS